MTLFQMYITGAVLLLLVLVGVLLTSAKFLRRYQDNLDNQLARQRAANPAAAAATAPTSTVME